MCTKAFETFGPLKFCGFAGFFVNVKVIRVSFLLFLSFRTFCSLLRFLLGPTPDLTPKTFVGSFEFCFLSLLD